MVTTFAASEGIDLTGEFVEVETGKGADALDRRPQLAAALALGRQQKCPVIVAKLDRLSRDVAFISGLMVQRSALGRRSLTEDADAFARNVLLIVESLRASGVTDLRGLASALNSRGVRTARGGRWHVSNVWNLLRRSAAL
jgi:DNA invertase Pin-like site-specific DNA recombinase